MQTRAYAPDDTIASMTLAQQLLVKMMSLQSTLFFISSNGPSQAIWKYMKDDFERIHGSGEKKGEFEQFMTLVKKAMVDRQTSKSISMMEETVSDMADAISVCCGRHEYVDNDTKVIRKMDIPYSNKYLIRYYRENYNSRIDSITTKKLINTPELVKEFIECALQQDIIAFDIETTGLDPRTCGLVGASFAYMTDTPAGKRIFAYYLPCGHATEDDLNDMFSKGRKTPPQITWEEIVFAVQTIIDRGIPIIMHNAAFDAKWMMHYGVKFPQNYIFHDTMIMMKCFDERIRVGLKESSMREYKYIMTKFEEVTKKETFDQVHIDDALDYACLDAVMTRLLWKHYEKMLIADGVYDVYFNIERPAIIPLCAIELSGCLVDAQYFDKMAAALNMYIHTAHSKIMHLSGLSLASVQSVIKQIDSEMVKQEEYRFEPDAYMYNRVNLASSQQVADILYDKLKLECKKLTEKNQKSTSSKALALIKNDHPVVKEILDYRLASKMLSSYAGVMRDYINPATGKIHTQIRQMGARSSRMSQTKPSLQVLPRDAKKWDIRKGFIAGPNQVIIETDYCQMELMMAGALSQDPVMLEAFKHHREMIKLLLLGRPHDDPEVMRLKLLADLHIISAAAGLHKKREDIDEKERGEVGKTLNFLTIYGGTEVGLADILTLRGRLTTVEEAKELIAGFFKLYNVLNRWLMQEQANARRNGMVMHECGRKIHNPYWDRPMNGAAVRTLVNSLDQGQCAALYKQAVARTHWALKHEINMPTVNIINLVHDAIYVTCPHDKYTIQKVMDIIRKSMEFEFKGVYFSVEQSVKTSLSKTDKIDMDGLVYA